MSQNRLAELRARRALATAQIGVTGPLVPIESVTNEVWAAGDVVVRLNRRLHSRLRREAELADLLPDSVPYPRILAVAEGRGADWVALERVPGTPLVRCWRMLSRDERRRAVREVAEVLRALHTTEVPPELEGADDPPQLLQPGPRATDPLLDAIDEATTLEYVDRGVLEEIRGFVRSHRSVLDPFESTRLIHGDLHFQNVLWDGHDVTALLDLEFARTAPADLDLDVFLRFCSYPSLFVPEGREDEARREDYDEVPGWLREEYPELFEHPHLADRLRIYAIAFDLKALLAGPPRGPLNSLMLSHPYRRLMATVRKESYVDRLPLKDLRG
jgi:aminoglycoside phosphotransferase (APT) family kinase protein